MRPDADCNHVDRVVGTCISCDFRDLRPVDEQAERPATPRCRDVDAETLAWWMNQSAEARAVFEKSAKYGLEVSSALTHIADELETYTTRRDLCVWSNAASFDIVILRSLYEQLCPNKWRVWNYQNERCYRTVVSILDREKKFAPERSGVAHSALDDAIWQAEYLSILNKKVGGTILR